MNTILARANPVVTRARVGRSAAAAAVLFGTWWAYTAAPRLAAEVTGGGVIAALALAYIRAQEALRRVEADNRLIKSGAIAAEARAAAEARETAVLMVETLVVRRTADLARQLDDAERRSSGHQDKAAVAADQVNALKVELAAAQAACDRMDATGRFLAAAVQWDLTRRSKKAVPVVGGVAVDADYRWREVEKTATDRWGPTGRDEAELLAAVEAVRRLDAAVWRLLTTSEYGLTLPQASRSASHV